MKNIRLLPLMLAGYLFLLIFRPYEYWPILGYFRIELIYMLFFMVTVFLSPDKRMLFSPLNGVILLFSVILIASGLFSMSWIGAWKTIDDYLKYVIFYFMVILTIRDEKDFYFIVHSFIAVMLLYVGKSAWEFFFHGRNVYRMGISRMVGIDITYGDPNSFAASICYSLPLCWALIQNEPANLWVKRCLYAYGALALLAIIMTGSRSGMVTALFFFFIILVSSSRKFVSMIVLAIILVFSWQFMPEDLQTRFLSTFYEDVGPLNAQQSAQGRMVGFQHGLKLFAENPLLGAGPGLFPMTWSSGMNAHNLFGQLLGEIGALGALVFIAMVYLLIFHNLAIARKFKSLYRPLSSRDESSEVQNRSSGNFMPRIYSASTRSRECSVNKNSLVPDLVPIKIYNFVAIAIVQTVTLMIFKGWGDHNLYRYTWLWLAALTVLGHHFFHQEVKRIGQS
jgi:O-antigen ligase